ncbi:MAG: hypothetical protein ABW154_14185 [Dyella sp.]|jgi:hypothetical protein
MSGLRFQAGELARYMVPGGPENAHLAGSECVVFAVGPWPAGANFVLHGVDVHTQTGLDYIVRLHGGYLACRDDQLRRLDSPSNPVAMTRITESEVVA